MTTRITSSFLEAKARTLNGMTKSPSEPYRTVDGKRLSNIGHYHINGAYDGYCLHRMATEGGGVNDVLDCGHVSTKQLAGLMSAYMAGLYDATRGAA